MNLDNPSAGDIEPHQYWFERELTQSCVTHPQPHSPPPNGEGEGGGGRVSCDITEITTIRSESTSLQRCELYICSSV